MFIDLTGKFGFGQKGEEFPGNEMGLGSGAGLLLVPGNGAGLVDGFGVIVVSEFSPGDVLIHGDSVLHSDGAKLVLGDGQYPLGAVMGMPGEGEVDLGELVAELMQQTISTSEMAAGAAEDEEAVATVFGEDIEGLPEELEFIDVGAVGLVQVAWFIDDNEVRRFGNEHIHEERGLFMTAQVERLVLVLFVGGDRGVAEAFEVDAELAERGEGVIEKMIEVGEPMNVDELGLPGQCSRGGLGGELGGEAGLADTARAIEDDDLSERKEVGSQPGGGAWFQVIGDGIGVHLKRHGELLRKGYRGPLLQG